MPGAICRNKFALSAVAVRRGSTTINFAPALIRSLHPQKKDRMAVRHVRAGHEEHVGVFEVLIGTGRSVGPRVDCL